MKPHRPTPLFRTLRLIALAAAMLLATTGPRALAAGAPEAGAQTLDTLLLMLADAKPEQQQRAIDGMVAVGDARLARALEAYRTQQLYLWNGRIVHAPEVTQVDGRKMLPLLDPLTGAAIVADGKPVVVTDGEARRLERPDRAIRQAVLTAKISLELAAADPEARLAAVRKVGDSREAGALPKLEKMAVEDASAKVRYAALESALLIKAFAGGPTDPAVLAAIEQLGAINSRRGLPVAKELRAAIPGDPAPDPKALHVYDAAIRKLESHETVVAWSGHLFRGLSAGSILVLMALGLSIIFGQMKVINMAHGEMMMIGAVTTWAVHELFRVNLPAEWFNWYFVAAFPAAFLAAALAGLLIELLVVRHLYRRPLESLLATIGVSFVLIQSVRLWKGDNLGMSSPSWFTGGVEVMQDVVLPYNRLFIIALTALCVGVVTLMLRFTRLGLMMRATVQNREVAQSLGVSTRVVDACTFSFGAGLAGIAGFALTLISNVTPEMGSAYTVDSFLVVVTGGVSKLMGVVTSGMGLGMLLKLIEPLNLGFMQVDATWTKVIVLALVVAFIQYRPSGLFADKGRLADMGEAGGDPVGLLGVSRKAEAYGGVALVALGLLLVPLCYATGLMSIEMVNKLGQFTAFAIVAIGLDLIWGFMGVLSLCQFLFFALGGYAMGMYLAHHGPLDGANQIPRALYVVSSSVGEITMPWFWQPFKSLPVTLILGLLVPGLIAFLVGMCGFVSRVRGVYFSILTQAITVAFWLIFQKNDIRLCGTNGLTNFVEIAGFTIAPPPGTPWYGQTRLWLYVVSVLCLVGVFAVAKYLVHAPFGRVLIAIRDDEARLRFGGYRTWVYKTAAFTLAGIFAGLGGMLYSPQKGIITPEQMTAFSSILVVVWVAVGGRGTLWGAIVGAISVNLLYDWLTSRMPDAWPFVLGGLFVCVVLILPGGLLSLPGRLRAFAANIRKPAADPTASAAAAGAEVSA